MSRRVGGDDFEFGFATAFVYSDPVDLSGVRACCGMMDVVGRVGGVVVCAMYCSRRMVYGDGSVA